MEVFFVSLLNGLVYGMLLFMLASGLTLIFSMMGVLNFAHASAYMPGAYFAYTLSLYVGFWWALLFAPVLCGLFGAGIEMYGLRRVHKNGHVAELLFTFGLALIIEKCVQMSWGLLPVPYRIPPTLDFALFDTFDFPAGVPGDPVALLAPFRRVAQAIDPVPFLTQQQQDFPARLMGKNH